MSIDIEPMLETLKNVDGAEIFTRNAKQYVYEANEVLRRSTVFEDEITRQNFSDDLLSIGEELQKILNRVNGLKKFITAKAQEGAKK